MQLNNRKQNLQNFVLIFQSTIVKYVSYKDLKEVTADLKKIYTANTEEVAHLELKSFAAKWDDKYPVISQRNCSIQFFAFPEEI